MVFKDNINLRKDYYKNGSVSKNCEICGLIEPEIMQKHHIHGRKNSRLVICVCPNCHARIHKGMIEIIAKEEPKKDINGKNKERIIPHQDEYFRDIFYISNVDCLNLKKGKKQSFEGVKQAVAIQCTIRKGSEDNGEDV